MTLQEAIKVLTDELPYLKSDYGKDFIDSIKLGIEALKRLEHYRKELQSFNIPPLPGETKE